MQKSLAPRIFIDTNVWFSAFYGSNNAEKILKAHIDGKIKAVICQQVLKELVRNVKKKIPRALVPLKRFLEYAPPIIVKMPSEINIMIEKFSDPKDKAILQSAYEAETKMFVTGNIKDFNKLEIRKRFNIEILSPLEAVKKLSL